MYMVMFISPWAFQTRSGFAESPSFDHPTIVLNPHVTWLTLIKHGWEISYKWVEVSMEIHQWGIVNCHV
jgi:hypothetical protein